MKRSVIDCLLAVRGFHGPGGLSLEIVGTDRDSEKEDGASCTGKVERNTPVYILSTD